MSKSRGAAKPAPFFSGGRVAGAKLQGAGAFGTAGGTQIGGRSQRQTRSEKGQQNKSTNKIASTVDLPRFSASRATQIME